MKRITHSAKADSHSTVPCIGIGIGAATVMTALLSMGLTSLVINGKIGENSTGIFIFVIRTVSVLLGGMIGTGFSKGNYLPVIGLTTLGYMIIMLGLGITLFNGSFQNFGMGAISVIIGGALACALKLKPPAKHRRTPRYTR